ncbi:MAG: class I SAM-dependent methyltransferase [Rickettsiales bacterium]|jgi:SAM-dependent methyltransferase|nr:class I SAM-dependent methyltransferase [Rickettsiales bacterium]
MLSNEKKEIFDFLYSSVDGYGISHRARNKMLNKDKEHLIYGEMSIEELATFYENEIFVDKIKSLNGTFYDLGSGTGKIVLANSLLLPHFKKFVGVELLKDLVLTANEIKNKYSKTDAESAKKIEFKWADFFNVDYGDADYIFMHYPMNNAEDLYLKLEEKLAKELKKGTIVVSVIRSLKNKNVFRELVYSNVTLHYGSAPYSCYEVI